MDATAASLAAQGVGIPRAARIVAGTMLGAAAAALLTPYAPSASLAPALLLLFAAICALLATRARGARDVLRAAALTSAMGVPFVPAAHAGYGLAVAGLSVAVAAADRGRSPLALLSAATFFVGARHLAAVDLLRGDAALPAVALLLSLMGYGAYVATQHAALSRASAGSTWSGPSAWAGRALALVGVLVLLAAFPLLDALGVTDAGVAALSLGALAGALLGCGIALAVRPLAATMATLLPLATLAFALLALGPVLAATVLVLLGAALAWQAEALRRGLLGTPS